ncbi:MAG: hypothetical protein M1836_005752 [Candelina mexicana]|nr:MAG: hypothetical protein M1836_005752 [Candelina mexicana]
MCRGRRYQYACGHTKNVTDYLCRQSKCKGIRSMELRFKVEYRCGNCGIKQWKEEWERRMTKLKEADEMVTRALTAIATMQPRQPRLNGAAAAQAKWEELKARNLVRKMLEMEKRQKLKVLAKTLPDRRRGKIMERKPPFPRGQGYGKSPLRNEKM